MMPRYSLRSNDTQHNDKKSNISIRTPIAECYYAECCIFVAILNVILVSVILVSVVAPKNTCQRNSFNHN
jgi:hypothetical protein